VAGVLAGSGARKPKRQQVARACLACKRNKAKCSDDRPCTRCVRLRIASRCVDYDARSPAVEGDGTVAVIERPVEYKPDRALSGARVQKQIEDLDVAIAERGLEWLAGPISRSVELGWDGRVMVDLFASLPDDWNALLKGACLGLKVIERHRTEKRKLVEPDNQVPLAEVALHGMRGERALQALWPETACRRWSRRRLSACCCQYTRTHGMCAHCDARHGGVSDGRVVARW
jgi:hypothetical protein